MLQSYEVFRCWCKINLYKGPFTLPGLLIFSGRGGEESEVSGPVKSGCHLLALEF